MSDERMEQPRALAGRAPDVFRRGGWVPMRAYRDDEEVDFAIVGTGAGGGTLAAKLAEAGFSVVAFDAGPYWRPLEDFASDEAAQSKLYWNQERISTGADPIEFGSNNSGRGVGGSTVHFTMVSLRFRPAWFKARSELGYGRDWPVSWQEMWRYYAEVEDALKIAGPVSYPWGPTRGRYPYRAHPLNAAASVLARGAEKMGVAWSPTPIATLSAPRGEAPPCVYRGFCKYGCSTNAKQSVLVTWIPRALAAGAEVRDLAMVRRIELASDGRVSGVEYARSGEVRRQRARNVVCAGYSIETPRLLLNSACAGHTEGLANANGMVGRGLMVHSNDAVYGDFEDDIRAYKAPPSLAVCEHWNYCDDKDFAGGYAFMSQGPLPVDYAKMLAQERGSWGLALREQMTRLNHMAGFRTVGEVEPREDNRVELAEETDEHGQRLARTVFALSDSDKRLKRHALDYMEQMLEVGHDRDHQQYDEGDREREREARGRGADVEAHEDQRHRARLARRDRERERHAPGAEAHVGERPAQPDEQQQRQQRERDSAHATRKLDVKRIMVLVELIHSSL
ncbi:MAG TPA: GMC family oxidoreductase N-terminal domain-containing protein [Polyangiales bacterium]|nr:GMC family oxidoreductase N-terminal domain-containing protein [Polyangiales bacterium]